MAPPLATILRVTLRGQRTDAEDVTSAQGVRHIRHLPFTSVFAHNRQGRSQEILRAGGVLFFRKRNYAIIGNTPIVHCGDDVIIAIII